MTAKPLPSAHFALKYRDLLGSQDAEKAADSGKPRLWPFSAPSTLPEGWRLVADRKTGRLLWNYLPTAAERDAVPHDASTKFFQGLSTSPPTLKEAKRPSESIHNGFRYKARLQTKAGCWGTDMSCILFVTPMAIIAWYITKGRMPEPQALEVAKHLLAIQNPEDGGWPTHLGAPSTLFGTVLIYVALRLMGFPPEHEQMVKARRCILRLGGAVVLPSWAKFWLCMLRLYEWEGVDPYPVEMWLLPHWVPVNPWKWYCITRQVYQCMTLLSSMRFTIPSNPLLDEIRSEIFADSFSSVDFAATQGETLWCDRQETKSRVLQCLFFALDKIFNPYLRTKSMTRRAEDLAYECVKCHDRETSTMGIISVDQFLCMIIYYAKEGPDSALLKQQQETSLEYLYMNKDGLQFQSIHGAQTWEMSLLMQSLAEARLVEVPEFKHSVQEGYEFLVRQQMLTDWGDSPPCYRYTRKGGWPFTVAYHGYACSDCTGESMKAIMMLEKSSAIQKTMKPSNLRLAVDQLLVSQGPSGGWASFEPVRTGYFLELFNSTELFRGIMVEHDYIECTSSVITALLLFQQQDPGYRADDVSRSIDGGMEFIRQEQRPNGSWKASWGIGFTYSSLFAMEALSLTGETYSTSTRMKKACEFLLGHQRPDGGWSEAMESVLNDSYTDAEDSHSIQTAWVLIALMLAEYPDRETIKRGIQLIMSRQKNTGEWPQEGPVGCGILTCTLRYYTYIYTFSIKALNMYKEKYGDDEIL